MTTLGLILKEIRHRKASSILVLLAVTIAVALFISFFTAGQASNRETARLMLSMGFNLHIIPKEANMDEFLLTGFSDKTMPAEYLEKLGSQEGFSYNHLLAALHKKISWRGLEVILTGLSPEICPPDRKKPPMSYQIDPGTVYVGYMIAEKFGLKKADFLEIRGKKIKVVRCLMEQGGVDDVRIQCHLRDAQDILKLAGQISEIQAVDCLCFAATDDPVSILRKQITSILPDTKVFQVKIIAMARAQQRQMVRNVFAVITPFVVVACGVWIGVLAMTNVRDRQAEIGIMRALGYGWGRMMLLFLGKAVMIGLLGAVLGFIAGTALALDFGPDIFRITAKAIRPQYLWLVWSLIAAPVFAAVSSFIPAMIAVALDPAVTLRQE